MEEFEELGLSLKSSVIYNDKINERDKLMQRVNQLDLDPNQWLSSVLDLWYFDRDVCEESISNFCAAYIESGVSSLRVACEMIVREPTFDFLTRCKAANALGNLFYTYEVLVDYMRNPKEDINFTVFVDNLANMVLIPDFTDEMMDTMIEWVFTTQMIHWGTKYKLFKVLCDVRAKSTSMLLRLGKILITSNPLSNYTVLCLQLVKFDNNALRAVFNRTKVHKDVKIKADIFDHMLNYNAFKVDAVNELKKIGEGMKTLDSSQNVHMISADVNAWITQSLVPINAPTAQTVMDDLKTRWKDTVASEEYQKIVYALQRIDLDNNVYGTCHYKLGTILAKVWTIIDNHEFSEELTKRLKEELAEMSETCSTGHLYRLMNVFSGFSSNTLTVDPTVELRSVINKRVENYMATLDDETQELVMDAWMEGNEAILQKHLYKKLAVIHDEVFQDYVGQGIMDFQKFTTAYRDIVNKLFVK